MCNKQLLSFLLLIVLLSMSPSVYAADALEGRKLAEQWCAKCHNIEKDAPFQ
jgi:cytochrome c2